MPVDGCADNLGSATGARPLLAATVRAELDGLLALLQLALALLTGKPNERLCGLARSLGRYLGQIAQFVGFASEQLPFPFSDWPGNTP